MAIQALAVNGAKVYICGRTEEKLDTVAKTYNQGISGQIIPVTADITKKDDIRKLVDEISSKEKQLDILINNAGYLESFVPLVESKVDDYQKVWDINMRGVYLVTRAFLPLLLKDGMKTILNTSSIGANLIMPGASGYQVGKLAVLRFGEFVNAEYGHQGIICFGIHPGGVPTELALNMPKAVHVGLVDKAELAGDAMVWLTAERREWLAGRYVSVNWDVEELLQKKDKIVEQDLLKVRLATDDATRYRSELGEVGVDASIVVDMRQEVRAKGVAEVLKPAPGQQVGDYRMVSAMLLQNLFSGGTDLHGARPCASAPVPPPRNRLIPARSP